MCIFDGGPNFKQPAADERIAGPNGAIEKIAGGQLAQSRLPQAALIAPDAKTQDELKT